MTISNYSDLVASVSNWLARSDAQDEAPNCIRFVEEDINNTFRTVRQYESAAIVLAAGDKSFAVPADYNGTLSLTHNTGHPKALERATSSYVAEGAATGFAGRPFYFADGNNVINLSPVADATYTLTLDYTKGVPALSIANPTNWLLSTNGQLYLYGALQHAALFLKDMEAAGLYGNMYALAKQNLRTSDNIKKSQSGNKFRPSSRVIA